MFNKNDKVQLEIIDITDEGLGVAKFNCQVFFVKNALPYDKVSAVITKITKNIIYAKCINIIEKSKYRVNSKCDIANSCGGCQLINLDYKYQLEFKKKLVFDKLMKIGDINIEKFYDEMIGMSSPCHYRNKMQVPFSFDKNKDIVFGFYVGRTHHIVPFNYCMVGFTGAEKMLNVIKDALNKFNIPIYDENEKKGVFREVFLRSGNNSNEVSLVYIINDKDFKKNITLYKNFDECVRKRYLEIISNDDIKYIDTSNNSVFAKAKAEYCGNYHTGHLDKGLNREAHNIITTALNINTSDNNVILGNINYILYGDGYINDNIGDIKYHISIESFYQVNKVMTKKLYDKIVEYGEFNKTENVLDLYSGIGTISLYISKFVSSVTGIEIVKKAVDDAISNSKLNNINNAKFIYADLCKNNDDLDLLKKTYDTIIVDPPRKGLDEKTIDLIIKLSPKKLIYVSCNPATLARDLKEICINNYNIIKLSNVDMFPHTTHVESIVLLSRV